MQFSKFALMAALAIFAITPQVFADENEQIRETYLKVENDKTTQKKDSLRASERAALFNYVLTHKVAALTPENLKKYDPTGEIGYCYGRAMAVHLRARRMGLGPEGIRKLFIIGDLRSGTQREWRFHVTTLVRGEDGLWYAIDPLLVSGIGRNRPEVLHDWVRIIRGIWDKKRAAHLYIVESNSIVPDIRVFPWEKADEKGDKITDLTFDPAKAEGLKVQDINGEKVYVVDRPRQEQYFLQAKEKVDADQFDFTRLKMTVLDGNQKTPVDYDYFKYFGDLVTDIAESVWTTRGVRPLSGTAPEGTEIHGRPLRAPTPQGTEIHGTEIHGTEIHGTKPHYGSVMPKPKVHR